MRKAVHDGSRVASNLSVNSCRKTQKGKKFIGRLAARQNKGGLISKLIGIRWREYLDRLFFWTAGELELKLESLQNYVIQTRVK